MDLVEKTSIRMILILLAGLLLLAGIAGAETIRFEPQQIAVTAGETVNTTIILSDAPGGLSGFRAVVAITPRGIAEISSIAFPSWAEFEGAEGVPGQQVMITGVDLNDKIEQDADTVIFATLSVIGIKDGQAAFTFEDIFIDDDFGDRIIPFVLNGSNGTSILPSTVENDDGATPLLNSTPLPSIPGDTRSGSPSGESGASAGVTGSVTVAITQAGTSASTGVTGQATMVPGATETQEPPRTADTGVTIAEVTAPLPEGTGIPFLTIPGIAVLFVILVAIGAWFRIKDGGN